MYEVWDTDIVSEPTGDILTAEEGYMGESIQLGQFGEPGLAIEQT